MDGSSSASLADLPSPPPGMSGWPWTVDGGSPTPPAMPDGRPWPRISIVTPSFNQGIFLEETIRSVLLQGYPDLEYIVMDGGSTDESLGIIRKYERWLTYWQSQPDGGQAAGINSGFERTSGAYMNWLNSDDILYPNALEIVARSFSARSDADVYVGANVSTWYDASMGGFFGTSIVGTMDPSKWPALKYGTEGVRQEATFFSRHAWVGAKGLNADLSFVFDTVFYKHVLRYARAVLISDNLIARMGRHPAQKTNENRINGSENSTDSSRETATKFGYSRPGPVRAAMTRLLSSRLSSITALGIRTFTPQSGRRFFSVKIDAEIDGVILKRL